MRNAPSASRRTYGGIKADQTLFSRLSSFFLERGTQYRCSFLGKSKTSFFYAKLTGSEAPLVPSFVYTWFCFFMLVLEFRKAVSLYSVIYILYFFPHYLLLQILCIYSQKFSYKYIVFQLKSLDNFRREECMNGLIFIV